MTLDLFLTGLLQGLILTIIAYAIMVPFRLLNFADLTSEGAYPLGGAVAASLISGGFSPFIAIIGAVLSSAIMGIGTGLVYLRFKVNSLLAGIILSTMVYSINLRIMGKPNIALFDNLSLLSSGNITVNIFLLILAILLFIIPLVLFLYTDFGLRLRAVGLNPDFATTQNILPSRYILLGLFFAGSLSGFAGSLMVQLQNYMDIGMGVGIVIHGLASLMIGESLIGTKTLNRQLFAPLVGALIYQQIQGLALSFGLEPSDLKFFTGFVVLVVIAIQKKS